MTSADLFWPTMAAIGWACFGLGGCGADGQLSAQSKADSCALFVTKQIACIAQADALPTSDPNIVAYQQTLLAACQTAVQEQACAAALAPLATCVSKESCAAINGVGATPCDELAEQASDACPSLFTEDAMSTNAQPQGG